MFLTNIFTNLCIQRGLHATSGGKGGGTGPNVSMFYLRKQEKWSQEIHQLPGLLKKQPNLENKIHNIEIRVVQNTVCQVMTTRN